jgi:hypothetical protein
MDKASILKVVGGLSAVGLTVGIVTSAQADDSTTSTPSPTEATQGYGGPGDQTALTGDALAQATASAQAAVPGGTVLRVEADGDGAIHAHVRTAEGTEVKVFMDGDYAVTSVEEFTGGRGGRGPGDQTALTGDALAQATASAQAAVPGGTVLRVEADGDGEIHAHVRTAEGTEVKVFMDGDYAVTSVEEFTGGRGGRGGDTPLTGDAATQATEAAQTAVAGGTVLRVEQEPDGSIHAHVRKDDGTRVVVVMDSSYQVTSVDELPARGGRGSGKESGSTTEDGATA